MNYFKCFNRRRCLIIVLLLLDSSQGGLSDGKKSLLAEEGISDIYDDWRMIAYSRTKTLPGLFAPTKLLWCTVAESFRDILILDGWKAGSATSKREVLKSSKCSIAMFRSIKAILISKGGLHRRGLKYRSNKVQIYNYQRLVYSIYHFFEYCVFLLSIDPMFQLQSSTILRDLD